MGCVTRTLERVEFAALICGVCCVVAPILAAVNQHPGIGDDEPLSTDVTGAGFDELGTTCQP